MLSKAVDSDYKELYMIQIKSFKRRLEKYQDYDLSPGAEKIECTQKRLKEPFLDYFFINFEGKHIGVLRVWHCEIECFCKLKQICILPEYQGNGFAQETIRLMEEIYPYAKRWELDTILQEEKLCYMYEKMGYKKTGRIQQVKDGMDLVFYEKKAVNKC